MACSTGSEGDKGERSRVYAVVEGREPFLRILICLIQVGAFEYKIEVIQTCKSPQNK